MQFIDEAKIFIKSGDGGDGCISFRREKYIARGGPNGGDGGGGASIIFKPEPKLNTLIDFRYQQHFKGRKGQNGMGQNRTGKSAEDIAIKIPIGTQVFLDDGKTMLLDMLEDGKSYIILKGGDGGKGNAHYKSSVNQAPRRAMKGFPGEEMWVWLKLKLLSDAGLLGFPNAGKSTFLSVATRAKPKIADYPFTTLQPKLGVVYIDEKEFVLADIPGLIKHASKGKGLGHKFLKHVERCRVNLHLIDASMNNKEQIVESYRTIRKELEDYNPKLAEKKEVIAINKCDAISSKDADEKQDFLQKAIGKPVLKISAATGQGKEETLRTLAQTIEAEKIEEERIEVTKIGGDNPQTQETQEAQEAQEGEEQQGGQ